MTNYKTALLSGLLASACLAPYCLADGFSTQAAVELLRNSNVLKPNAPLHATYDSKNKRAILLTDRLSKATDDDCKIDAVLLSKKLMDSFPDEVNQTRVIFDNPANSQTQHVDVSKVDVKAYGSGAVKASELLASLNLVSEDSASLSADPAALSDTALSVAPGPFASQRLVLLGRIEQLRKRGTGVAPFQKLFAAIETEAKAQDETKLRQDIPYLSEKLSDQDNLVKQAAHIASQRPPRTEIGGAGSGQRSHQEAGSLSTGSSQPINSDMQDVITRCQAWDEKISDMKKRGVDTGKLEGLLLIVRTMGANPQSCAVAKKTLDEMDKYKDIR